MEEYLGDLLSLESLQKALVQYSAVASRVLMFVDPGGVTNATEVAEAPSGEVLDGDAKDITLLTLDKYSDFQTSWSVAQALEKRLENAFLLVTSASPTSTPVSRRTMTPTRKRSASSWT